MRNEFQAEACRHCGHTMIVPDVDGSMWCAECGAPRNSAAAAAAALHDLDRVVREHADCRSDPPAA